MLALLNGSGWRLPGRVGKRRGADRCWVRATGRRAETRIGRGAAVTFYQKFPRSNQVPSDVFDLQTPNSPHPEHTRRALAYLHDRGAHFVLLAGKKPLWQGYLKRRPALETVLHSPELGIIPWSVGSTALDVDRGEPVQLCLFHPPWSFWRRARRSAVTCTTGTRNHAETGIGMLSAAAGKYVGPMAFCGCGTHRVR